MCGAKHLKQVNNAAEMFVCFMLLVNSFGAAGTEAPRQQLHQALVLRLAVCACLAAGLQLGWICFLQRAANQPSVSSDSLLLSFASLIRVAVQPQEVQNDML